MKLYRKYEKWCSEPEQSFANWPSAINFSKVWCSSPHISSYIDLTKNYTYARLMPAVHHAEQGCFVYAASCWRGTPYAPLCYCVTHRCRKISHGEILLLNLPNHGGERRRCDVRLAWLPSGNYGNSTHTGGKVQIHQCFDGCYRGKHSYSQLIYIVAILFTISSSKHEVTCSTWLSLLPIWWFSQCSRNYVLTCDAA